MSNENIGDIANVTITGAHHRQRDQAGRDPLQHAESGVQSSGQQVPPEQRRQLQVQDRVPLRDRLRRGGVGDRGDAGGRAAGHDWRRTDPR